MIAYVFVRIGNGVSTWKIARCVQQADAIHPDEQWVILDHPDYVILDLGRSGAGLRYIPDDASDRVPEIRLE